MLLAKAIGNIYATVKDPATRGAKILLLQPIRSNGDEFGEALAAVDTLSAGPGDIVCYTTAYEAVIPWKELNPGVEMALIDAAVVAIVDRVQTKSGELRSC